MKIGHYLPVVRKWQRQVGTKEATLYLLPMHIHLLCVHSTDFLEWHLIAPQCNVRSRTAELVT